MFREGRHRGDVSGDPHDSLHTVEEIVRMEEGEGEKGPVAGRSVRLVGGRLLPRGAHRHRPPLRGGDDATDEYEVPRLDQRHVGGHGLRRRRQRELEFLQARVDIHADGIGAPLFKDAYYPTQPVSSKRTLQIAPYTFSWRASRSSSWIHHFAFVASPVFNSLPCGSVNVGLMTMPSGYLRRAHSAAITWPTFIQALPSLWIPNPTSVMSVG